jgi:glycosyltransferase involved in cell wall biosynthesis
MRNEAKSINETTMKSPVIYYFCPDLKGTIGGVKTMYRHVDILNKHHFNAAILHSTPGFRCDWFLNETPIAYVKDTEFSAEDIVVFPEPLLAYFTDSHNPPLLKLKFYRIFSKNRHKFYANELSKLPVRKVIFNQNTYLTFEGLPYSKDYDMPYLRTDVEATLCVSEDNLRYLQYVFPELPLHRVRLSANKSDFFYQPEKKRQIALTVDRSKEDVNQILNILKIKKATEGFDWVFIQNKTEKQVAQILKDALIFLSFGKAEGFSLPPMEAMLCGCIVVGYHGRAGAEYFDPEYSYPVEIGNIIGFAQQVEEVLAAYQANPQFILEKGKRASEQIARKYDIQLEEEDLIRAWTEIIRG